MNNYLNIYKRWQKVCGHIFARAKKYETCGRATKIDELLKPTCDALEKLSLHSQCNYESSFAADFHAKCMEDLEKASRNTTRDITILITSCEQQTNIEFHSDRAVESALESIEHFLDLYKKYEHGIDTRAFERADPQISSDDPHKDIKTEFKKLGYCIENKDFREGVSTICVQPLDPLDYSGTTAISAFTDCVPETLEKLRAKLESEEIEKHKGELFV